MILEDFEEKSSFLKKNPDFSTSCPSHIVTFFSELSRSASVKFLSVNFFIHNQLLRNFIADTFITLCMGGLPCDHKQPRSISIRYTLMYIHTSGEIIAALFEAREIISHGVATSILV